MASLGRPAAAQALAATTTQDQYGVPPPGLPLPPPSVAVRASCFVVFRLFFEQAIGVGWLGLWKVYREGIEAEEAP